MYGRQGRHATGLDPAQPPGESSEYGGRGQPGPSWHRRVIVKPRSTGRCTDCAPEGRPLAGTWGRGMTPLHAMDTHPARPMLSALSPPRSLYRLRACLSVVYFRLRGKRALPAACVPALGVGGGGMGARQKGISTGGASGGAGQPLVRIFVCAPPEQLRGARGAITSRDPYTAARALRGGGPARPESTELGACPAPLAHAVVLGLRSTCGPVPASRGLAAPERDTM